MEPLGRVFLRAGPDARGSHPMTALKNCLRLCLAACALAAAGARATNVPLVEADGSWFYHKGTNAPQAGWKTLAGSAFTATASASHESSHGNSSPQPSATCDFGPAGARLGPGAHTLAIIGLNDSLGSSSDFIQIAGLYLAPAPLVAHTEVWRYRKGTNAPPDQLEDRPGLVPGRHLARRARRPGLRRQHDRDQPVPAVAPGHEKHLQHRLLPQAVHHHGDLSNDLHQYVLGAGGAPPMTTAPNYPGVNDSWRPVPVFHDVDYAYGVVHVDGAKVTIDVKHRAGPNNFQSVGDLFTYTSPRVPVMGLARNGDSSL